MIRGEEEGRVRCGFKVGNPQRGGEGRGGFTKRIRGGLTKTMSALRSQPVLLHATFSTILDDPRPLRSKTSSPRSSSPAHSFRSSCSDNDDDDDSERGIITRLDSSDGCRYHEHENDHETLWRGRTLARGVGAVDRTCSSRASLRRRVAGPNFVDFDLDFGISRDDDDDSDVDVDAVGVSRRRDFIDVGAPLSASPEEMDKSSIFEPFPARPAASNLAEILLSPSSSGGTGSLDSFTMEEGYKSFINHRDTFEIMGMRRNGYRNNTGRAIHLPHTVFQRLLRFVDFQTYLSLRLSCRCWSASASYARPVRLSVPAIAQLPAELLQLIFAYLSRRDLDAAKTTCRAWMAASLSLGFREDRLRNEDSCDAGHADKVLDRGCGIGGEEEPWLGETVATESSFLFPRAMSNGLGERNERDFHSGSTRRSGWRILTETDWRLSSDDRYDDEEYESELLFTMSGCGEFVLATRGRLIYICSFSKNHQDKNGQYYLDILTSIACPSRVQAVSMDMDTSHQRFCIEVLMEGRLGMVCEIYDLAARRKTRSPGSTNAVYPAQPPSTVAEGYRELAAPSGDEFSCSNDNESSASNFRNRSGIFLPPSSAAEPAIPIEEGPYFLYPHVCPDGDVPFSVAVCLPQQQQQGRCAVAFGSATGVKLFYVDALTGQALSHWFPLTTRSEVLWFIPLSNDSRPGSVDEWDPIRLVSSMAACPFTQEVEDKQGDGLPSLLISPGLRLGSSSRDEWLRDVDESTIGIYTHQYRHVVPLSDGWHYLYIDPESGLLCLGRPLPVFGDSDIREGARKLRINKRFTFEGPVRVHEHGSRAISAGVFQAAQELRWGLRLAVSFGNQVWGFCISRNRLSEGSRRESDPKYEGEERRIRVVPGVRIGAIDSRVVAALGIKSTRFGMRVLAWGNQEGDPGKEWKVQIGEEDDEEDDGEGVMEMEMKELKMGARRGKGEWETEGLDGDVVMRDADSDWNRYDERYENEVLRYADGSRVVREGEEGEDVVMRDGDGDWYS